MFYQRKFVKTLFNAYVNGTATRDELMELGLATMIFTENDFLAIAGEAVSPRGMEVTDDDIQKSLPEARMIIERSKARKKNGPRVKPAARLQAGRVNDSL